MPGGLCCLIQYSHIRVEVIRGSSLVIYGCWKNRSTDDYMSLSNCFGQSLHVDRIKFIGNIFLIYDKVDVPFDLTYW